MGWEGTEGGVWWGIFQMGGGWCLELWYDMAGELRELKSILFFSENWSSRHGPRIGKLSRIYMDHNE